MLFIVAAASSLSSLIDAVEQVPRHLYQGIELRLDALESIDPIAISNWMATRRDCLWLFTMRSMPERIQELFELCTLAPDYVDLEWDLPTTTWKKFADQFPNIRHICSYHQWEPPPLKIPPMHPAHLHKIAFMTKSSLDALKLHRHGIGMGHAGLLARLLSRVAGNPLNYAAITTHPFIPTVRELETPYRYSQLNPATTLFALIGSSLEKSPGIHFHNAFFDTHQINSVYLNIPLGSDELSEFVEIGRTLPFQGLSVTMPFKEAILPHLDAIDPDAQAIGAVNTVAIQQGKWIGYNTDGIGALNAIEEWERVSNRHVVILGAGGTARAIVFEALRRGAKVTILNRNEMRAQTLAQDFQCDAKSLAQLPQMQYDLLINTTPDGSWVPALRPCSLIMDVAFDFSLTIAHACRCMNGHAMWKQQAMAQQHIWRKVL